jgi:hypothetical protein
MATPVGRVRRGRLCAAASAALVTVITLLGAVGLLPTSGPAAAADGQTTHRGAASLSSVDTPRVRATPTPDVVSREQTDELALPADSGQGKRIVFDMSAQRVWLVGADDDVRRTYLVSGSLTDNLHPGSYAVYSRSRWAVGVDDSGTMEFFVRFTQGANAAIGFHSIPTKNGHLTQTRAQLGSPQSHGCIRQARPDAIRLWNFAPIGTKVVVTA